MDKSTCDEFSKLMEKTHWSDQEISSFVEKLQSLPNDKEDFEPLASFLTNSKFFHMVSTMFTTTSWQKEAKDEDITLLSKLLKQCGIHIASSVINVSAPSMLDTLTMSRNKIEKSVAQNLVTVRIVPKTWYMIEKLYVLHTAIVKNPVLKDKPSMTISAQIQEDIEKLMMSSIDSGIKIKQILPSVQCCKVRFVTSTHRNNFVQFVKEQRPEWSCEAQEIRQPQIRLRAVKYFDPQSEASRESFIRMLENLNEWPTDKDVNKVISYNQSVQGKIIVGFDIILQILPAIREKIERNAGVVNVGYSSVDAVDYFGLRLCKKCARYGHLQTRCKSMFRCGHCGKNHKNFCPVLNNPLEWFCPNCRKTGHNAFQTCCRTFLDRLKIEIEKINYPYEMIMA